MGQKPQRIAYLFKRPKADSKNKHRHICQLNPETKYFPSTNEMEGLLSPQI